MLEKVNSYAIKSRPVGGFLLASVLHGGNYSVKACVVLPNGDAVIAVLLQKVLPPGAICSYQLFAIAR